MTQQPSMVELEDIHGTILRARPLPFVGDYVLLHIDDPVDGQLRCLAPRVASGVARQAPVLRNRPRLGANFVTLDGNCSDFRQDFRRLGYERRCFGAGDRVHYSLVRFVHGNPAHNVVDGDA